MTKTKKVRGKRPISANGQAHCQQQQPVVQVVQKSTPLHTQPKFSLVARSGQLAYSEVFTYNKKEDGREAANAALSVLATDGTLQVSSGLPASSQPVQISKKAKVAIVNKKKKKSSVQKVNHQLPETILPNGFGLKHSQLQLDSSVNKPNRRKGKVQHQPNNPISAFMEVGQSCRQQPVLDVIGQSGPPHKPIFTIVARIGQRAFPPVLSHSKKDGRKEAAEMALRILALEGTSQSSSRLPINSQSVMTKSHVPAVSQKSKKSVKQDMNKKKKKGSVEDNLPEKDTLPSCLDLGYPQIGQQSDAGSLQGKKGKVQLQPNNPISAFIEYGQSCRQQPVLEVVGQSGPAHKPKFTVIARIGQRAFPEVVSDNKKDGRKEAAEVAVRMLAAEGAFQSSSGLSSNPQPVVTKNPVHAVNKKPEKVVNQGVKEKKKQDSAPKVKGRIAANTLLPNNLTLQNPPVGQHSSTDKPKRRRGKVQLQPSNPISAFIEYGQSCRQKPVLEVVGQSGPAHKPKFTVVARIGKCSFPPVVSDNKKDGRREAAKAAIRTLAAEGAFQLSSRVSSGTKPVQTKSHVHVTSKKLKKVVSHGLSKKKKKKGSAEKVKDQRLGGLYLPKISG